MKTIAWLYPQPLLLLAALLAADAAVAHQVIAIADGDTLTLSVHGKRLKIRLANIDAPEKTQAFGRESRRSLSELCLRKDAQYQAQDIDQYGRTVAVLSCDGVDASRAQVERGMAWVQRHYNRDAALMPLQEQAKSRGLGLWSDARPLPPWEYRHAAQPGYQAVADAGGVCHTGPRGGRYRIVNGRKRYGC
jgi:micrococcal nuclease